MNIGKLGGNAERELKKKMVIKNYLFILENGDSYFIRIRKSKLLLYQYEFDMFSWLRKRHWIWVRREFKCGSLATWTCQIALNSKHLLFFYFIYFFWFSLCYSTTRVLFVIRKKLLFPHKSLCFCIVIMKSPSDAT